MASVHTQQLIDDIKSGEVSRDVTTTAGSRIRVLPDLLVNKIAAGEVVERPASVVKELVENSIDAGATRISVTVEDGGRQLIRVTDDGCGMTGDELRLSVLPHATSKLTSEEDLYAIRTMGFRGEALASISSVSKLRIVSRPPEQDAGHEVQVVAEDVQSSQAAGCPIGTTVEVRDLFFNVPGRRKFLRAASTEVGHISEQLSRIALAHPSVGFELRSQLRLTLNLPASATRLERVAKFYGPELASALLSIHRNERGLEIEAFAAPPAQSRATAQWQYLYVNGRYVRDRFIQHAVKEAYRGLMEPNRHGVVFIFLTIDPGQVDVNVHPTKIEVRWADSNMVHSQVLSALRETFQRADLSPALRTDRARDLPPPEVQDRMRLELASMLKSQLDEPRNDGSMEPRRHEGTKGISEPGAQPTGWGAPRNDLSLPSEEPTSGFGIDPLQTWRALYGGVPSSGTETDAPNSPYPLAQTPFNRQSTIDNRQFPARPRAIQMHNLYLVAETDDGILIIDQHALHERVMYEQLRQRIATGPLESQRLLLPETIPATARQLSLLEQHADLLHRLGIDSTAFGADAVAIHALPSLLKDTDAATFMRDLLDYLEQQPTQGNTEVVIHKILDMMACKAAVKAGDPLSDEEIDSLMRQRHLVDKATSCPHGRPTILRLTKADLNRQFKR